MKVEVELRYKVTYGRRITNRNVYTVDMNVARELVQIFRDAGFNVSVWDCEKGKAVLV